MAEFDYAALLKGRDSANLTPFTDFRTGAYSGDTILGIQTGMQKKAAGNNNVTQANLDNNFNTNVDKKLLAAVEANPEGEFYKRSVLDKAAKETIVGYFDGKSGDLITSDVHKTRDKPGWLEKLIQTTVIGGLSAMTGGIASSVAGGSTVAAGAAAGGTQAALTHQDILKGIAIGAATGGIAKGVAPVVKDFIAPTVGNTAAGIIGKGAAGGLNAAITGKDPLTGALMSAIPGVSTGNKILDNVFNKMIKTTLGEYLGSSGAKTPVRSGTSGNRFAAMQPAQQTALAKLLTEHFSGSKKTTIGG